MRLICNRCKLCSQFALPFTEIIKLIVSLGVMELTAAFVLLAGWQNKSYEIINQAQLNQRCYAKGAET